MVGLSKFEELRTKTDKQLIQLIGSELDLGMRVARHALKSADALTGAVNESYFKAEQAHAKVSRLIRLAYEVTRDELNSLEARLEHLREMLGALAAIGSTPTENKIAALAHVLWKARGCPEGMPEADWFRAEQVLKPLAESHTVCEPRLR